MMRNQDSVAFITGGGRGLGLGIARKLLSLGGRVAVVDNNKSHLDAASRSLGSEQAAFMLADVTDPWKVDDAIARTVELWGGIDTVINNAGILEVVPSSHLSDESLIRTLQVHLGSAVRTCRAAYPLLCRSDTACVVNVSSITALRAFPGRLAYAAAKAGLEALTRTLATEWGSDGIRVNAVAPGFVRTERAMEVYAQGDASAEARIRMTPLGRMGEPEEIADVVAWLASARSSFVTGQVIVADGGFTISAADAVIVQAAPG